jgi:hypothetical protein
MWAYTSLCILNAGSRNDPHPIGCGNSTKTDRNVSPSANLEAQRCFYEVVATTNETANKNEIVHFFWEPHRAKNEDIPNVFQSLGFSNTVGNGTLGLSQKKHFLIRDDHSGHDEKNAMRENGDVIVYTTDTRR